MAAAQSLNLRPLLVLGAVIAAAVAGFMVGSSQWVRPVACFAGPRGDPVVDKALDIYGNKVLSRDALRKSYDINLVYLPTMTCVGFNLLPGTAGGDSTMCFDASGKRVVLKYRNGD